MTLYIRDPDTNLSPILREYIKFAQHSGLHINWAKSIIVPLTDSTRPQQVEFPLEWQIDPVRYLGIWFHRNPDIVIRSNYGVAITKLEEKIARWIRLPLSLADRLAIIKMVILPKILYLFNNIPIKLPKTIFQRLNAMLTTFIWAGKTAHIELRALALPYSKGGFKVPDLLLYYLCAQAQYAHYWYHPIPFLPHVAVENGDAQPIPLAAILPYSWTTTSTHQINTIATTNATWQQMGRLAHKLPLYAPALPLHFHPHLSVTQDKVGQDLLRQVGIVQMGDFYANGTFVEPQELHYIKNQTLLFHFTYHRLRGAIKKLYTTYPLEPPQLLTLQLLLTTTHNKHMVTKLYPQLQCDIAGNTHKAWERWNAVLDHPLETEEWEASCTITGMLTPNDNLRMLHYKYLHQCTTPRLVCITMVCKLMQDAKDVGGGC